MDARRFMPTDIGKIVNRFLTQHFHRYVEYGFTAAMEDELDAVSRGEEDWTTPLEKFWKPFIDQVENIEKNVTREQVAQARELGKDPATGKPITVRMGRFGPFVQIGTKDDEEKPRFAGLRPGPEDGRDQARGSDGAVQAAADPRGDGRRARPIVANVGRFGPYVKYGSKYVSLKEDDPYTVTLERALEVIRPQAGSRCESPHPDFADDGIQVLNGRYGPYITDKKKNAKIPKDRDPKIAHARGVPRPDRGGAGARPLRRVRRGKEAARRRRQRSRRQRATAAAAGQRRGQRHSRNGEARGTPCALRRAGACRTPTANRAARGRAAPGCAAVTGAHRDGEGARRDTARRPRPAQGGVARRRARASAAKTARRATPALAREPARRALALPK